MKERASIHPSEDIIAISKGDHDRFGCTRCGHHIGWFNANAGHTHAWRCKQCGTHCLVITPSKDDKEMPSGSMIVIYGASPLLQPHPLAPKGG